MKQTGLKKFLSLAITLVLAVQMFSGLGVFAATAEANTADYELGDNILQDTDFDDIGYPDPDDAADNGTADWLAWVASVASAGITQDSSGILDIDIDSIGDSYGDGWSIQLTQKNIQSEIGKQYVLEFDIESTMTKQVGVYLQKTGYDFVGETISLTAGVSQHFSAETAAIDVETLKLVFALGKQNGVNDDGNIYISNISLREVLPLGENFLRDPDFEDVGPSTGEAADGTTDWIAFVSAGSDFEFSQDEPGKLAIDVKTLGWDWGNDSCWGVQLTQKDIQILAGKEYVLEFDIESTLAKQVGVFLQMDGGDAINEMLTLAADEPQHFRVKTDTLNVSALKLVFQLGTFGGESGTGVIYISNIKLRPVGGGGAPVTAKPIAITGSGKKITFQQVVDELDTSAEVYYGIYESKAAADAVSDATELTDATMATNANGKLWEYIVNLPDALQSGQAIRYALAKDGSTPASGDFETYVYTPAADYEVDTLDRTAEGYNLVWNDEFNGTELDTSKWSFQIGTKAPDGPDDWGNQEDQYYTDKNHSVEDGKLTITAKKETMGSKNYTSTRIRTITDEGERLFSTTYGRVEARMKLPTEEGTWPAFWMLPDDSSIYEGWAASGEIDIMEARGRVPGEVGGTIHYGAPWPGNVYGGKSYEFDTDVTDISGFHLYSLDWTPDKLTWYVDDEEYYSTSNWYAIGANAAENFTYGAPFDVPFHIILNLAVGGTFDPAAKLENADLPASMQVDYVRVYHKAGGYNDDNVVKPDAEGDTEFFENNPPAGANGNYIDDTNFSTLNLAPITDGTAPAVDPNSPNWQFFLNPGDGGAATQSLDTIGGTTYAKIDIASAGSQTYAIQLIKHMPFAMGYTYEVSFDAKASASRNIIVKPGGDADNGWSSYASFNVPLSTEITRYTYTFTMNNDSDPTARLEFNLGSTSNAGVWVGNVTVKQVEAQEVDNTDMAKTPFGNGEQIYNGTFDQGTGRLAFWHLQNVSANVPSVVNNDYSRKAILTATGTNAAIYQTGMELLQSDQYALGFDFSSEANTNFNVMFTNSSGSVIYMQENYSYRSTDGTKRFNANFAMPNGVTDRDGKFILNLQNGTTVTVDNISLKRTTSNNVAVDYTGVNLTPIPENSEAWSGVDVSTGERDVNTNPDCVSMETTTAGVNYQRMILHPMDIKEGVKYLLRFSYKAEHASTVGVAIQEDESWATTYENLAINATTEWQDYEAEFRSTLTTGSNPLNLKFYLSGTDMTPGWFYIKDATMTAIVEDSAQDAPAGTATAASEITRGSSLLIQIAEGSWRTSFMSAAASGGKAVIMVGEVPLTDYVDITTLINATNGTITIPAAYLNVANKNYRIELALEGYSNVVLNTTVKTSSGGSSSGSSGSGGGSGGGGTSTTYTSSNVSANGSVNSQTVVSEATQALSAAGDTAVINTKNAVSISPSTLKSLANAAKKAGKSIILHADTLSANSRAVQGRLYVEPAKLENLASDLKLGIYTDSAKTAATKTTFDKYFENKVAVIHCEQQGSFTAKLKIAAKVNLTGMDTGKLVFYSYDKATKKYARIPNTAYFIDKNGYLHFYTEMAGDIIISEGLLERK